MKLFYTPAACSISAHVVLEEIGESFDTQPVDILNGESRREPFLSINPKGKVPTLLLADGTAVTENPVILYFLAKTFPEQGLLADGFTGEIEVLQLCEYLTGTVQNHGIGRLFAPAMFCADEEQHEDIRKQGEQIMSKGFDLIAPRLETRPFLFDRFSIADASLFYFELHAARLGIVMPEMVRAHFEMMTKRASVQNVFAREGLNLTDFIAA